MQRPLVSVIINNFNYARFLDECIAGVLCQTYDNIELIVVDDGSTDGSREILSRYRDRANIVLKENGGQASAFNAGFRESTGELVCFLDSDDLWLAGKVERTVMAAISHPRASIIYNQVRMVDAQGNPYGKPGPKMLFSGDISSLVMRSCGWWGYPPTSALTYTRGFLESVMDIPEERFRLAADAYLAQVAPFVGEVHGFMQPLTLYRIHGSNYGFQNNPDRISGERAAIRRHINNYVNCADALNYALDRLGLPQRVNLDDHWPYHYHRWKLGEGPGTLALSRMAWRFPALATTNMKARQIAKLWLERSGIRRR